MISGRIYVFLRDRSDRYDSKASIDLHILSTQPFLGKFEVKFDHDPMGPPLRITEKTDPDVAISQV
jgi:hypothetical protein